MYNTLYFIRINKLNWIELNCSKLHGGCYIRDITNLCLHEIYYKQFFCRNGHGMKAPSSNEEPARMMCIKRRRSDRSYWKTSWRRFFLCWCRIAGKSVCNFLQDFGQKKHWASCGIFIENEISRTLHWCTKSYQNKCYSVLFWDEN
jgi:hypothetical protein